MFFQNRAAGPVSTGGHPRHPPSGIYRALPLLSFLAWQKTGPVLKSCIRRDVEWLLITGETGASFWAG